MDRQQVIQQAKDFIYRERPDLANRLRLNDINLPLCNLRELVSRCHSELDDLTIIKMIDRGGERYLRCLAKVNMEVSEICLNLTRSQLEEPLPKAGVNLVEYFNLSQFLKEMGWKY
jgi:hypothetical protein